MKFSKMLLLPALLVGALTGCGDGGEPAAPTAWSEAEQAMMVEKTGHVLPFMEQKGTWVDDMSLFGLSNALGWKSEDVTEDQIIDGYAITLRDDLCEAGYYNFEPFIQSIFEELKIPYDEHLGFSTRIRYGKTETVAPKDIMFIGVVLEGEAPGTNAVWAITFVQDMKTTFDEELYTELAIAAFGEGHTLTCPDLSGEWPYMDYAFGPNVLQIIIGEPTPEIIKRIADAFRADTAHWDSSGFTEEEGGMFLSVDLAFTAVLGAIPGQNCVFIVFQKAA